MNWENFVKSTPWIATVQTCNNDWTIYACLQQVCKQFENVIVVDDGSTDRTLLEVDRFIRREKPKNFQVVDVSSFDPWPNLVAPKREWQSEGTSKTQSKAKFKAYTVAKQLAPQLMWVSVESDVIVMNDARVRMIERISRWKEPETDCEFFNLVMSIDPWHVRCVSKYEDRYEMPDGIKHRREYDHPGDWGLAASWLGGKLAPGPDPVFPYGPCYLPWLEKNQLGKKGQDNSNPFGFHMLSYRDAEKDTSYEGRLHFKVSDLNDPVVDWDLLHKVRFPVVASLDNHGKREVLSCEW